MEGWQYNAGVWRDGQNIGTEKWSKAGHINEIRREEGAWFCRKREPIISFYFFTLHKDPTFRKGNLPTPVLRVMGNLISMLMQFPNHWSKYCDPKVSSFALVFNHGET